MCAGVVLGQIGFPPPFARDPPPASEPDLAIDDQQLSMGAVVQLLSAGPVIQLEVMKLDDLRTSVAHLFYVLLIDLFGANDIENDMHFHAIGGTLRQRVGELLSDFASPIDVSFELDRPLGPADRLQ